MKEYRFAKRMNGLNANAIREIFKLLSRPEIISFAGGMPGADCFPTQEIARISAQLIGENGAQILQYGATEGYPPLKIAACAFLEDKGIKVSPEDMLILSGGQQGIDLICKAMLDPGDRVLVEQPTYLAVLHILKTYQGAARAVQSDSQGMLPEALERAILREAPKFIYLVPTFQNPTGRTMGLERRQEIVKIAEKYGVLLVEDDPYRDLRYAGEALPALKSFDGGGHVAYITSFSKLISPGLRVGACVADQALIQKMTLGKQATDVHTSNLSQAIVERFLTEGLMPAHLGRLIEAYSARLEAMDSAMAAHFPAEARYLKPEGGLFVWVELPEGVDTTALLRTAVEHNVAFVPGADFHADGSGKNTLRLNFSASGVDRIQVGVEWLGALLKQTLSARKGGGR